MEDINNQENTNNNQINILKYFSDIINPIRVEIEENKIKNAQQ